MLGVRASLLVALISAAAVAQQPRIDTIVPSEGPITGGTVVTLSGSNLERATVKIDKTAVTPLSQTPTEIRMAMPPRDNGIAPIHIGSATAEYLYVPPRLEELPPGYITTVAGIGGFTRDYGPATQAPISPWGLALDGSGNLYISTVRR